MTRIRMIACLLASGLVVTSCSDDFFVPDPNSAGLEELTKNPTPAIVRVAVQGLMSGATAGIDGQGGYVSVTGIFGRESLVFEPADARWIDELVLGRLNPGAFGGFLWAERYRNIRQATAVLEALEVVVGFTESELEAMRGFAKTIMAYDLLLVINTRDTSGAVIEPNPFGEELAPIVGKDTVFDRIEQLLSEAAKHLQAGGASFPFDLSSGFTGFDTPATFVRFVRALHARVAVYREDYAGALNFLAESLLDENGDFDLGVYNVYGSAQGQSRNGLFQGADPNIAAFPTLDEMAKLQPGGALDQRFIEKIDTLDQPLAAQGVMSDLRFSIYTSLSSPIPIIRNEELILLRAEARWFTNDIQGALEDLNRVRTAEGNLEALVLDDIDTENEFVDELLYDRAFSLIHEGGHSWIDHRRFGRLADLPNPRPGDRVPSKMPIPRNECLARELMPTVDGGCG